MNADQRLIAEAADFAQFYDLPVTVKNAMLREIERWRAAAGVEGTRAADCALVCQAHKAGGKACRLGECERATGAQELGEALALRSILARIHRDGGQYVAQHGMAKAWEDAEAKVAAWLACEDAAGEAPSHEALLRQAREFIDTVHDGEYGYSDCTRDELVEKIDAARGVQEVPRG